MRNHCSHPYPTDGARARHALPARPSGSPGGGQAGVAVGLNPLCRQEFL